MHRLLFSERLGLRPLRSLQVDEVDDQLRNRLWNVLKIFFWDKVEWSSGAYTSGWFLSDLRNRDTRSLCQHIWHDYFKRPLDTLSDDWTEVLKEIRDYFFSTDWCEVYDFIEFVAAHSRADTQGYIAAVNEQLERELSAYRFVDSLITRVIDQAEICSIEEATETTLEGPRMHIRRALELLADRKSPDYRNSIKESISAVEAVCRHLTGRTSGTLAEALAGLKADARLHPALRGAFSKLYGYTSDEGGIRHALLETDNAGFDEAKFMLVACSAFVNFMSTKFGASGPPATGAS